VDLGERVRRIVAFNTYDFADGIKRANLLARLVVSGICLTPGVRSPETLIRRPLRLNEHVCRGGA
jgi:hypothetical protein